MTDLLWYRRALRRQRRRGSTVPGGPVAVGGVQGGGCRRRTADLPQKALAPRALRH